MKAAAVFLMALLWSQHLQGSQGVDLDSEKYLLEVRVDSVLAERGVLSGEDVLALLEEARVLGSKGYWREVLVVAGECIRKQQLLGIEEFRRGLRAWPGDEHSEIAVEVLLDRLALRTAPSGERRSIYRAAMEKGQTSWKANGREGLLVWYDAAALCLAEEFDDLLPLVRSRLAAPSTSSREGSEWLRLIEIEMPLAEARSGASLEEGYLSLLERLWQGTPASVNSLLARDELTQRICARLIRSGFRSAVLRLQAVWEIVRATEAARAKSKGGRWIGSIRMWKAPASLLGAVRRLSGLRTDEAVWASWFPVSVQEAGEIVRAGGLSGDSARQDLEKRAVAKAVDAEKM